MIPRYQSASGLCVEAYAKVSKQNFFLISRSEAIRQPRRGTLRAEHSAFKKMFVFKMSRPQAIRQPRRGTLRAEATRQPRRGKLFLDGMDGMAC